MLDVGLASRMTELLPCALVDESVWRVNKRCTDGLWLLAHCIGQSSCAGSCSLCAHALMTAASVLTMTVIAYKREHAWHALSVPEAL
jgi:hypothetical protein